jgi:hypothetical protein
MSIDRAHERFKAVAADVEKNLARIKTEQDARFQIINRVITEVLGWPIEDVETEPHTKAGYVDYSAGGQAWHDGGGLRLPRIFLRVTGSVTAISMQL